MLGSVPKLAGLQHAIRGRQQLSTLNFRTYYTHSVNAKVKFRSFLFFFPKRVDRRALRHYAPILLAQLAIVLQSVSNFEGRGFKPHAILQFRGCLAGWGPCLGRRLGHPRH